MLNEVPAVVYEHFTKEKGTSKSNTNNRATYINVLIISMTDEKVVKLEPINQKVAVIKEKSPTNSADPTSTNETNNANIASAATKTQIVEDVDLPDHSKLD